MAVTGLEELAQSLGIDDRRRKLASLRAIADLAELLNLDLLPELEASARSFDTTIARAALEALTALASSSSAAAVAAGLRGAA